MTNSLSFVMPEDVSDISDSQEEEHIDATITRRQSASKRTDLWEVSQEICKLFTFAKADDIHKKLLNHRNNPRYKIIVLEDYINDALEGGHEVNDAVFQTQEVWHDELIQKNSISIDKKDILLDETPSLHCDNVETLPDLSFDVNEYIENFLDSKSSDSHTVSDKNYKSKKKLKVNSIEQSTSKSTHTGNAFSTDIKKELKEFGTKSTSNNGSRIEESQVVDETCEIVDFVKYEPCVIDLEEDSNPSASSDIVVVEEVKKSNLNNASTIVDLLPSAKIKKDDSSSEIEDFKNFDNIEDDPTLWKEANTICDLLPSLQLNNIHQSLLDNYYHPQRKSKVLGEYIELALEEGHDIDACVFETLNCWQVLSTRKRSNDVDDDDHKPIKSKKIKLNNEFFSVSDEQSIQATYSAFKTEQPIIPQPTYPVIYNSLPHGTYGSEFDPSLPQAASSAVQDIPVEQNLPSSSYDHVKALDANDVFNGMPDVSKKWYQLKVDFLSEIAPGLTKNYILSQIIYCKNESDIMFITPRLLEESSNLLNDGTPQLVDPVNDPNNLEGIDNEDIDNASFQDESLPTTSREDSNQLSAADVEDRTQAHIQQLGEMFSDADPDFLAERANEVAGDHDKFVVLVVELTENRSYPKMEEYLKRQQKMEMRRKFIEGMSVDEFLEYFEDPEKVFCDTSKEMSKLYMNNAKAQLMKDLPFHLSKIIDTVLRSNNYHYLPSLRALREENGARKTKRTVGGKQPGDLDDIFLKELCYAKMEEKIKEFHKQKEELKKLAFEQAKEAGDLQECQCCYDDEILQIDMSACENTEKAHFFCNNCIKRYSEEQIGQGRLDFVCLNGECKVSFSLNTLKKLLKPSIFSNLLKRKQAEEIAAAGIEDLESCSFCNFATIMPNKEDKVFKCLNPECLKDSCRLCKEPNHIPLRCEEVEKKKQTDARTYLENEMSEAVVRECYKCKKRFIKEEGCNKMLCSCGAMMCYLCKQPIKGYDHFSQDRLVPPATSTKSGKEKCPLWSNSLKLHAEEVQQRAAEAKKNLDPNVELIHDPTKDLPQVPDYLKMPNAVNNVVRVPPVQAQLGHGINAFFGNPGNNLLAEFLLAENRRRIQRHSHQHRHTHFYIPMAHLPPPPPAHLPPPPPAHHHQHQPPPPPPPYQHRPHFIEQYRLNRGINRGLPNFGGDPRQDHSRPHPHVGPPPPLYYHQRHNVGGVGNINNQLPIYQPPLPHPGQFHHPPPPPPPNQPQPLPPPPPHQQHPLPPPLPHQQHQQHFYNHRPPRNQRPNNSHHLPHTSNSQRYQY